MTTPTTNFGWGKPSNGGDSNAWGNELNAIFDAIDASLFAVEITADAALPLAGGAMTGRLDVFTSTVHGNVQTSVNGTFTIDLSTYNYISVALNGNTTFAVSNTPGSNTVGFILVVIGGGSFTLTWPGSFKWPGAAGAPALSTGADALAFISDDHGTTWRNVGFQKNIG